MLKIKHIILFCALSLALVLASNSAQASSMPFISDANTTCTCSCNCQPIDLDSEEEPAEFEENEEEVIIPLFTKSDIVISEFISDPASGEEEGVELYNTTENEIDLDSWTLLEGSGSVTSLSGIIKAYGFLWVKKSSLNNSGDQIILQSTTGEIIDQVSYGNWDDGQLADNAPVVSDPYSVIRANLNIDSDSDIQDFVITRVATPGEENILRELAVFF